MGIQVTDLHLLRDQLIIRRQKLESATAKAQTANLLQLLEQVDRALERVDHGSYGVCEACQGTVEPERLLADPLTQLCLDCLKPAEQRALERVGFRREGVMRGVSFVGGHWRDMVLYARLRDDPV